jgi:hypothetical protein
LVAEKRGGSNFIFFDLNGCNREKYAVLPNYLTNKSVIDGELTAMYKTGQRRLRVSLPVTTEDAQLDANTRLNVNALLTTIVHTGFEGLLVVIGGGRPPPQRWKTWNEQAYQYRWRAIQEYRMILLSSGIPYRLDLLNEGVPGPRNPRLLYYVTRLWNDYVGLYGAADTVGFSIIATPQAERFSQLTTIYKAALPSAFDLHVYKYPELSLKAAHAKLQSEGLGNIPWIIGETFYNDKTQAEAISRTLRDMGRRIEFLTQWPLSSREQCMGVDIKFPSDFTNYSKQGF